MFTAALFRRDKVWKQPKCPSVDEWINQMWYIYTMEYYLAIKKKKIVPFVTVWSFLNKLKMELPYDPVIPLLGIYPKKPQTLFKRIYALLCSL